MERPLCVFGVQATTACNSNGCMFDCNYSHALSSQELEGRGKRMWGLIENWVE